MVLQVKFFPAEAAQQLKDDQGYVCSLHKCKNHAYRRNPKNISEYLECDETFCGGSWMVKGDMVGEFDKIKDMTAEAVSLVKKIRGLSQS